MKAMSMGVEPIPVKADYFTKQVKTMAEDMKQLDTIEDSTQIEGTKSDFQQLRNQLKALADAAKHMNDDINKKYPGTGGGGC